MSTGVAAWRMPKKRGKYHAGAAPKTAPHPLWHKPDHGSWIGSAKEDWPAGATEFTVSFEVHDPSQAHFALQHSADSKVASASLVLLGAVISTAGTPSGVPTQVRVRVLGC